MNGETFYEVWEIDDEGNRFNCEEFGSYRAARNEYDKWHDSYLRNPAEYNDVVMYKCTREEM